MRDVAVVSFAQSRSVRREQDANEVEMLMPVLRAAVEQSGIDGCCRRRLDDGHHPPLDAQDIAGIEELPRADRVDPRNRAADDGPVAGLGQNEPGEPERFIVGMADDESGFHACGRFCAIHR